MKYHISNIFFLHPRIVPDENNEKNFQTFKFTFEFPLDSDSAVSVAYRFYDRRRSTT